MQDTDFSRFTPEALKAIETSARLASSCNSNIVMPCHLIGGLASVKGEEVCSILRNKGYDPDSSMDAVAQGMAEIPWAQSGDGMLFHPEVEEVFEKSSAQSGPVEISTIVNELLNSDSSTLDSYLIKSSSHVTAAIPTSGIVRDYQEDDSTTRETIERFCVNMRELAANGKLNHAIGRDKEVKRVLQILARSTKNNPVLVGEPGTGKTAIAEEMAIRLLNGQVPPDLAELKLYSLDFSSIKSLPDAVGVMKSILEEATNDPSLVLFIDEIHMLISTCNCSDNDIANLLKPAMARGEIKIFGATTLDEYRRIERDPAFERRFQKVIVDEPDIESAIEILKGAKAKYEAYHNVSISDEVCESAVNLSARYITNRRLPDKAIDLIDEAAANLRIEGGQRREMVVNDIMKVVTAWTGIPVDDMDANDTERLQNIEQEL